MSSPILIWTPDGGTPAGELPGPPDTTGSDLHSGITPLVSGQSFVDVVFPAPQESIDWTLIECAVFNIIDASPLNIWAGIVTVKTVNGFRVQLNGLPDNANYYLSWTISGTAGEVVPPTPATTYTLTGPASGNISTASGNFTVQLPAGGTVTGTVTVTPGDSGGGGTFTPATVALTTAVPSATFTYTPASYGAKTISTTNDGGLTDPASVTYTCVSSTYSLTGPSTGLSGSPSTNFTVQLPSGGVVIGTVTVTPHDGGAGGTFTPTTVNLTTGAPSATFTYTPSATGAKTISTTNGGGLTDPANLTYTATAGGIADGDPVSTWPDSSGNGHTATQTGSARPIYKTAILNGKPVVRFTAAGLSSMTLATAVSAAGPYTMFVVMKPTIATNNIFSLTSDTASGGDNLGPCELGAADMLFFCCKTFLAYQTPNPHDGAFHVFEAGIATGASSLVVDGANQTIANGANTATDDFKLIGYRRSTGDYTDGDIAEIILYNSVISGADLVNIRANLILKWFASGPGGADPSTVSGMLAWFKADAIV